LRMLIAPLDRDPRRRARWEMDLSPGTVVVPRNPSTGSRQRGGSSSEDECAWEGRLCGGGSRKMSFLSQAADCIPSTGQLIQLPAARQPAWGGGT
jgi:hypothetical protein